MFIYLLSLLLTVLRVHESTGFSQNLLFIAREVVFTQFDFLFGDPPDNPSKNYVDYAVKLREKMAKADNFC